MGYAADGILTMTRTLDKIAICMAGMLALTALPAYADTLLVFDITGTGTYTTTGGSFNIGSIVYGANTLTIPAADELSIVYATSAGQTVCGSVVCLEIINNNTTSNDAGSDFAGVALGTVLYTAAPAGLSITGTETIGAGGVLNLKVTDTQQAALNANFLTDIKSDGLLPIGTQNSFTILGGIIGSDSYGTNYIASDTISLMSPEPSSMFLFGAGLSVLAAFAGKRRFRRLGSYRRTETRA
jgi:hypothetical protein